MELQGSPQRTQTCRAAGPVAHSDVRVKGRKKEREREAQKSAHLAMSGWSRWPGPGRSANPQHTCRVGHGWHGWHRFQNLKPVPAPVIPVAAKPAGWPNLCLALFCTHKCPENQVVNDEKFTIVLSYIENMGVHDYSLSIGS